MTTCCTIILLSLATHIRVNRIFVSNKVLHTHCIMLIFKHMCVASDSRTIVVVMLLFVENEYEIGITVRSLGVSGVTRNYLTCT